jgi:hypothetical protein
MDSFLQGKDILVPYSLVPEIASGLYREMSVQNNAQMLYLYFSLKLYVLL